MSLYKPIFKMNQPPGPPPLPKSRLPVPPPPGMAKKVKKSKKKSINIGKRCNSTKYFKTVIPIILFGIVIFIFSLIGFVKYSDLLKNDTEEQVSLFLNILSFIIVLFILGFWWKSIFNKIWISKSGFFMSVFFVMIFFHFIEVILNLLSYYNIVDDIIGKVFLQLINYILIVIIVTVYILLLFGMINNLLI